MDTDNVLKFFRSRTFVIIIIALFSFALLVGAFTIGAFVGYKKATFSYRWGENYHLNFGGPAGGFFQNFRDLGGRDFIGGHGMFGRIIKIDGSALVVKGSDNVERIILVKEDASITHPGGAAKLSDLKVNNDIVVIGEPNDQGQIEAKFIRVMPFTPTPSMLMPMMR